MPSAFTRQGVAPTLPREYQSGELLGPIGQFFNEAADLNANFLVSTLREALLILIGLVLEFYPPRGHRVSDQRDSPLCI